MKSKIIVLLSLVVATLSARAITISQWTFEPPNTPSDVPDSATGSSVAADGGNGTASGVHASAATDWTTPPGNGSANSLNVNTWTVGDYWQFQLSTVGYENIMVSWDQTSSSTGPRDFGLFWSLTGLAGSFTQFGANYAVLVNGSPNPDWSSGTPQPAYNFTRDLSSVAALDDDSSVFFRLILQTDTQADGVGTVAAGGTDRVDNFTVTGDTIATVPDTGTTAMLLSIPLLGFWTLRRFTTRSV